MNLYFFVFCRFDPSTLNSSLPSPFTSTLTLNLPQEENSLTYQVGLRSGIANRPEILSISPIFHKPSKNNNLYYCFKFVFIMHLFNISLHVIFHFLIYLCLLLVVLTYHCLGATYTRDSFTTTVCANN